MSKKTRTWWLALALAISGGLALVGMAFAHQPPAPQPKKDATPQAPAKQEEAKKPEGPKPGEDKPFDEVVKEMELKKGLFTFYYKADENKLLMELSPDQLDKVFLFAGTTEQAVGERGLYSSQQGGSFPFVFHRVGKSIQWIEKNTRFTATSGTPAARYTARSFPDPIQGTTKIQSKPHPERKSILVDAAELFVSDLPGFAPDLNHSYQPTVYRFDKANSALGPVKVFPENVLLDVTLHYTTDNPRVLSVTLPDERSIPILVKYDLSSVKDPGYKPRLADDRVGQFLTIHQDFTNERTTSPYTRYIHRWQLENPDPAAKLSPPKQPIVFWLENTIPVQYREWFKEGVLLWNKAFERIGFKDAIEVKQQPDDANWEAADTRYSTIRWFGGVDATFAVGWSRANPFTGQVYDADIGFSEGIIRAVWRDAEEFVTPVFPTGQEESFQSRLWGRNPLLQCNYAEGLAQQAAFGVAVLEARGELTPEVQERVMREWIIEVTAHEVGHTLGLRHNFRASTILKVDELNDLQKTDTIGQTGSVMDYNPIFIASKGYQVLRRAVGRGLNEYNRALLTSSKYIGGIYHVRDHAGDPHGRPPYTAVPAAKQREALEFLRTYAFSEKSFQLPPGVLNKLAIERQPGLDFIASFTVQRIDFPRHDAVLNLQRNVLNRLYHPLLVARVKDSELRFARNEKSFTMADLFKGLDGAIWSELDTGAGKISSLRRNLQREHLKQLIRLVLRPAPASPPPPPSGVVIPTLPTPRPPEDATTLARASLVSIQAKIRQALSAGKVADPTTKAHLEETQARISTTLQAQLQKPLE